MKMAWNRAKKIGWYSSARSLPAAPTANSLTAPPTLSALATIGEWLVDMHGPHDHQSLLNPGKQLLILDAFGKLEREREAFGEIVRRRSVLDNEKSVLIVDEKTYPQQLDLLRF